MSGLGQRWVESMLFAGRPVPKKGFDIFVHCASSGYELVVVGGEYRPMEVMRNGGRRCVWGSPAGDRLHGRRQRVAIALLVSRCFRLHDVLI